MFLMQEASKKDHGCLLPDCSSLNGLQCSLHACEKHKYHCFWCNNWSRKDLWGVGRITCPMCEKAAPSPSEIAALPPGTGYENVESSEVSPSKSPRFRSFSHPWRRFAIRLMKHGEVTWWTDDGTGCDDAQDNTDWDSKRLVTYVTRAEAVSHVNSLREWAKASGLSLCVMLVWEYPGGVFEQRRRPKNVSID